MSSKRPYGLPSLKALAAFDAAARTLNFRAAADDLNVTPAAISHQVKALEADLGTQLFQRQRRGVFLTDQGLALAAAVKLGFAHIGQTTATLRHSRVDRPLTVHCSTAFSALWLTPQLARFWSEHPDIEVNQHVTDAPVSNTPADLVIDYGIDPVEGAHSRVLFLDSICALAAPALANRVHRLDDIPALPLIHLDAEGNRWTTWDMWFKAQGLVRSSDPGSVVNSYAIALQLAQAGRGAVLGWQRLTQPLVDEGRLARLGSFHVPAPRPFRLHQMPSAPENASVLFSWLLEAGLAPD
ncbi:MAG: LysR substrate-binding domain-containing protein [Rhodobacteraceae bacterium]|nr:LysR substrate-binding domain-containing protein [Paracoccaceae bacterium]